VIFVLDYVICECSPLTDRLFYCAPVRLQDADLNAVYLGPSGAFAVVSGDVDPERIRIVLRELFATARVFVYHPEKGLYNGSAKPTPAGLSRKELDVAIYQHTTQEVLLWDDEQLDVMLRKLRVTDGQSRGIYRDENGNWFIARNGKFKPLSDHDSNSVLRLTLLGGILGIHRFALGKWASGIMYVLTGGLMGLGWLLDLIQLNTGLFPDKVKKVLAKPEKLSPLWYISGLAASSVLFIGYLYAYKLLGLFVNFLLLTA